MADLLDIAPSMAVEAVKIDGKRLVVRGLSLNAIAHIAARFPDLMVVFGATGEINMMRLIQQFGSATGPIIAAGCGHLGDEKYEKAAGTMPVEYQLRLLTPIVRLTLPNGFGPLTEAMAGFANGAAGEMEKPVRVRLRKSPPQSQSSPGEASRPTIQ